MDITQRGEDRRDEGGSLKEQQRERQSKDKRQAGLEEKLADS